MLRKGHMSILRALQDAKLHPPKHGQVQILQFKLCFVTCGCRVLVFIER